MKTHKFSIDISAHPDVSEHVLQQLLDRLINCGLEDAAQTLENNEGDVDGATLATSVNISSPRLVEPTYDIPATIRVKADNIEDAGALVSQFLEYAMEVGNDDGNIVSCSTN